MNSGEPRGSKCRKEACDIRRYECRRTKLHEITSQPGVHFVRTGNESAIASRRDHEETRRVASRRETTFGERKPILVRVLSVGGRTARDFRRWARSIFEGERDGFLPTAVPSRRLEKCRPGKATTR